MNAICERSLRRPSLPPPTFSRDLSHSFEETWLLGEAVYVFQMSATRQMFLSDSAGKYLAASTLESPRKTLYVSWRMLPGDSSDFFFKCALFIYFFSFRKRNPDYTSAVLRGSGLSGDFFRRVVSSLFTSLWCHETCNAGLWQRAARKKKKKKKQHTSFLTQLWSYGQLSTTFLLLFTKKSCKTVKAQQIPRRLVNFRHLPNCFVASTGTSPVTDSRYDGFSNQ